MSLANPTHRRRLAVRSIPFTCAEKLPWPTEMRSKQWPSFRSCSTIAEWPLLPSQCAIADMQ